MKACAECRACLAGLAARTAAAACPADSELRAEAAAAALSILTHEFRAGATVPPRLATRFQREIRAVCGVSDPFRKWKEGEFAAGRRTASRLAPAGEWGAESFVRHAVLGNQIDFFRSLEEVERLWGGPGPDLAIDELDAFEEVLAGSRAVLVLGDNAGEVPFDLPLLSFLQARGRRVRYAVKGAPSQNDATRADVERFGLDLPGLLDTGTDAVGCELSEAGGEFLDAWAGADVVLAKGMANYETLTEYPQALDRKPVFFLLCAKCGPVAASLGVPVGAAALTRGRAVSP